MNQMLSLWLRILLLISAVCTISSGQTVSQATLEIHSPDAVAGFWGRYFIIENQKRSAGWITSEDGISVYKITGIHASDATRFRAIVYVPGCALQTVDLAISERKTYQYTFRCVLIPQIQIQGTVSQGHAGDDMTVEAKYVAGWAAAFFQYDDGTTTEIPLGDKTVFKSDEKFSLKIPDLSKDKLVTSPDHPGEIRIWVRQRADGPIEDQLRLISNDPAIPVSRMGGIPISALSENGAVLHFCETESFITRDSYGFAIRDDAAGRCKP
jgi:hypothetical protein